MTEEKCDLASKKCSACTKATPFLSERQRMDLIAKVPKWKIGSIGETRIQLSLYREIAFKNFAEAVGFINRVAVVAEKENHHPDFALYKYRHVNFRVSTHAIHGLSENDFILAAKIDALAEELGL